MWECDLVVINCVVVRSRGDCCVEEVPASKPGCVVDFSSRVGSGDVGQRAEPR